MGEPQFATVKICYSRPEMEVVCSMLAAHGIDSYVNGREMAAQDGQLLVAIGGMEVRVPSEYKRAALQLLDQTEDDANDEVAGIPESRAFWDRPLRNSMFLVFSLLTFEFVPIWLRDRKGNSGKTRPPH